MLWQWWKEWAAEPHSTSCSGAPAAAVIHIEQHYYRKIKLKNWEFFSCIKGGWSLADGLFDEQHIDIILFSLIDFSNWLHLHDIMRWLDFWWTKIQIRTTQYFGWSLKLLWVHILSTDSHAKMSIQLTLSGKVSVPSFRIFAERTPEITCDWNYKYLLSASGTCLTKTIWEHELWPEILI